MDAAQIEKLKALALAASPGPWQWWTSNSALRLTAANGRDGGVLSAWSHHGLADLACSREDQAFIEASNPATVLELIVENERLRADAERWRAFRARDEFDNLDFAAFRDEFREDADSIIDAAIGAHTNAREAK